MKLIIGLLLIAISFFGTIFFRNYHGTLISHPGIWYTLFFAVGLVGALLIYNAIRGMKTIIEDHIDTSAEKLKSHAKRVQIDFDKCEFKSGSFSHQIEQSNATVAELLLQDSPILPATSITENIIQSYLKYTDNINGEKITFISHAFPFDETTLKFYVLNNNISLYIDESSPQKYLFEIKK
ncbi:MAG: hypothetical protein QM764_07530 [Chitinophagaceae bacterium]